MNDRIIRIPLETDIRMVALKPAVERMVQEQVGKKRTDVTLNTKGNFRFERQIMAWRDRPLIDLRRKR